MLMVSWLKVHKLEVAYLAVRDGLFGQCKNIFGWFSMVHYWCGSAHILPGHAPGNSL